MGRALRPDERGKVPLPLFDNHGPSRANHNVHLFDFVRLGRFLGIEQDPPINIDVTITLFDMAWTYLQHFTNNRHTECIT